MEKDNFFELSNGDIYKLEYIIAIIKDESNDNYIMHYKNDIYIILNNDEYIFIRKLIRKFAANTYSIY